MLKLITTHFFLPGAIERPRESFYMSEAAGNYSRTWLVLKSDMIQQFCRAGVTVKST